jgi:hypothetical protein
MDKYYGSKTDFVLWDKKSLQRLPNQTTVSTMEATAMENAERLRFEE